MDYLEFQRIWQVDEFFEIKITCCSEIIKVTNKVYTSNQMIDELYFKINNFLNGTDDVCLWENGNKGDDSTAYISLQFIRKDTLGHILIEVYLELDDGGKYTDHNCCFYIKTEMGLLAEFCKNLSIIKEKQLDIKVTLNQY